jgi:hypothetical protein
MNEPFKSLLKFMEQEDRNGDWINATIEESETILSTILEWVSEGLDLTPRIQGYIDFLSTI